MWRRQAGSVRSGPERSGSKRNVSGAGIGGSEGSAPLANVPRESQDIETSEGTPAPQSAPPLHPDTQSASPSIEQAGAQQRTGDPRPALERG